KSWNRREIKWPNDKAPGRIAFGFTNGPSRPNILLLANFDSTMIQRYSRAEMREIWSEQRKLEIWLQIELLASEALVAAGVVPAKDFARMKAGAAFQIERCRELERTLNHDVIAFTTNVAENIGAPASRWLHFGLTSSDIIDTALAVQMVQSAD